MKRFDILTTVQIELTLHAESQQEAQDAAGKLVLSHTPGLVTILSQPEAFLVEE